jgi:hypothetical protein
VPYVSLNSGRKISRLGSGHPDEGILALSTSSSTRTFGSTDTTTLRGPSAGRLKGDDVPLRLRGLSRFGNSSVTAVHPPSETNKLVQRSHALISRQSKSLSAMNMRHHQAAPPSPVEQTGNTSASALRPSDIRRPNLFSKPSMKSSKTTPLRSVNQGKSADDAIPVVSSDDEPSATATVPVPVNTGPALPLDSASASDDDDIKFLGYQNPEARPRPKSTQTMRSTSSATALVPPSVTVNVPSPTRTLHSKGHDDEVVHLPLTAHGAIAMEHLGLGRYKHSTASNRSTVYKTSGKLCLSS